MRHRPRQGPSAFPKATAAHQRLTGSQSPLANRRRTSPGDAMLANTPPAVYSLASTGQHRPLSANTESSCEQ